MTATIKIIIGKEIKGHGVFGASLSDGTELVASSRQPFLDAARVLIASGYDPDSWLEGWRPGATAFALRGKLGIAAGLTVDETRTVFARWKPFSRSAVSASIRHSDGAAITPATSDRRTSECAPDDEAHGKSSKKLNAKSENRIGGTTARQIGSPSEKQAGRDRLGDKNNGAIEPIRGSRSGSEGPFRIRPK